MASSTAGPFRILDLPAEVRNHIYRQVFADAHVAVRDCQIHPPGLKSVLGLEAYMIVFPWQILLACRQISQEAVPVLYKSTELHAAVSSTGHLHHIENLISWRLLAQLTTLRITLTRSGYLPNVHPSHLVGLLPELRKLSLVLDFRTEAPKFIRNNFCTHVSPDPAQGGARYSDERFHHSLLRRDKLPPRVKMLSVIIHPHEGSPKDRSSILWCKSFLSCSSSSSETLANTMSSG